MEEHVQEKTLSETATNWQEYRRLRGWELHQAGWTMEMIAEALGVTKGAVSQWCKAAREEGVEGLRTQPRPGYKKLDDEQRQELKAILSTQSAEVYGFHGNVWNCSRIAQLIEMEFDVTYHPAHVSKIMKELGLTPQRPKKKKTRQDPKKVQQWWEERWPQLLRKAEKEERKIVWVDESGFYLIPMLVRTYAPKGNTPIIEEFDAYAHLSVISGLTVDGQLYMSSREDAFTTQDAIQFLEHMYAHTKQKLLVIWDGAPIHRSQELKRFLKEANYDRFYLEMLPAYSPELNPDEGVWNYLKRVELKNRSCMTLQELKKALHQAFVHLRTKKNILLHLIRHSGYEV